MNKYYFREFVDTLVVALRQIEKAQDPVRHIHPIILRDDSPRDPGAKPGEQSLQPSAASSHTHSPPKPASPPQSPPQRRAR